MSNTEVKKQTFQEFISAKLKEQLKKITLPKTQRIMLTIKNDYDCDKKVWIGYFDNKDNCLEWLKHLAVVNENSEILIEFVIRTKSVSIKNGGELFERNSF